MRPWTDKLAPCFLCVLAILLGLTPGASWVRVVEAAETAEEWLRESQAARFPGGDQQARFVILIERNDGTKLKRKGIAFRHTRSDGFADRLFVVRSPDSLTGLALLSKDRATQPAAQWLYVPTYRRARRVALHSAGDGFVGSDFTYSDFGRVRIEAGRHRIIRDTTVGERACVVIETFTTDRALPYARLVSTLDRTHALPLRTEYYDQRGRLTRAGTIDEIVDIDGLPTPLKFTMTNETDGGQSVLKLVGVRYDVGLDPDLFTVEQLEAAAGN